MPARELAARRVGAQPGHGPDADQRAEGQGRDGDAPAEPIDQLGHQMDGQQGEQEAGRGLHGQHGADQVGCRELGDAGRELCRGRDHRDAPDEAEDGRPERRAAGLCSVDLRLS